MLFTGFNKRNIYTQDDIFNYTVNVSSDNITGNTNFGFSGSGSVLSFSLESGKVYAEENPRLFLYSYQANEQLNISGNVSKSLNDLYINNNPIYLGRGKNTGAYNYFFVDSKKNTSDLSLRLQGNAPGYSYDPYESFYSGQNIPVTIYNSGDYPFKIFSGNVLNNTNFVLTNVNNVIVTGLYSLNLNAINFSPFSQTVPIQLYTNFGNVLLNFTASGIPNISGDFYLTFGPDTSLITDGNPTSYTLTAKNSTGLLLYTSLEYVNGATGDYFLPIVRDSIFTGEASGIVVGSGNVSSTITGEIFRYNELLGQFEYGTGQGIISKFIYSSGNVSYNFSVPLIGGGSGLISTVTGGTGFGEFTFNGVVGPNGGLLTRTDLTGLISGFDANYGVYYGYTQSGIGSVFVKSDYTGSQITGDFTPDQYENVNFITDVFFVTGRQRKIYNISGLAWATGRVKTGKLQGDFGYEFEPGDYVFSKNWTGIGSGNNVILTSFDPTQFTYNLTGTTGIISGTFYSQVIVNGCNFDEPIFVPTGIPYSIYNSTGLLVSPLNIFLLQPTNTGEYTGENSFNSSSRTNISRRGNTASGSGYFDNVFREPFYDGIWTESLTGTNIIKTGDKKGIIGTVSANPFLYNDVISGYFKVSGVSDSFQKFTWKGRVNGGNFSEYSTTIYGIDNTGTYYTFPNSYNFSMDLKTGTYGFILRPASSSPSLSPTISFPGNITEFSNTSSISIPFQLPVDSTEEVRVYLKYNDGTARNGVTYSGSQNIITFPGGIASTQFLNIPIINNSNVNSFFGIEVTDIQGGYISNRNQVINSKISININEINSSIDDDYNCCSNVIPTGKNGSAVVTLCNNLLGNQKWSSGDGVFTNTLQLLQPVPEDYVLAFKVNFSGINDRYKMKAYSKNGQIINVIDTLGVNPGFPVIINTGIVLPSQTYGIISEVYGGYNKAEPNRQNWNLEYTCTIDDIGEEYPLPSACADIDFLEISKYGGRVQWGGTGQVSYSTMSIYFGLDSPDPNFGFLGIYPVCSTPLDYYLKYENNVLARMGEVNNTFNDNSRSIINLKLIRDLFPDSENLSLYSYVGNVVDGINPTPLFIEYIGYKGGTTGVAVFPGSPDLQVYIAGGEIRASGVSAVGEGFSRNFLCEPTNNGTLGLRAIVNLKGNGSIYENSKSGIIL